MSRPIQNDQAPRRQAAAARPASQLPLYVAAWVVASLVVSEITASLRGPWQPFVAPQSHAADGQGAFVLKLIMTETVFGLLNGGLYLLLLSLLLRRVPAGGSLFLPSLTAGLLLGLACVGGWTGFLYSLLGHLSHPGVGQRMAVGVLPYLVSGAVAGCVRLRPQDDSGMVG